jgi:hypothetical protein
MLLLEGCLFPKVILKTPSDVSQRSFISKIGISTFKEQRIICSKHSKIM